MKKFLIAIAILSLFPWPAHADTEVGKRIYISIGAQRLAYFENGRMVDTFLISSGLSRTPTPVGTFPIMAKIPVIRYRGTNSNGTIYDYPNTKWNMRFFPSYYIHGAYWHNAFGTPRSHGCINVSYDNMEKLYNWAEVGTPVTITK